MNEGEETGGPGRRSDKVALSLLALALITALLAFFTEPFSSNDVMSRLSSPALQDSRDYRIMGDSVSADGFALVAGSIPGVDVIRGMHWYVNGSEQLPRSLTITGNAFSVELPLPQYRDRWTLFAIATCGFAHYVPMRTSLVIQSLVSEKPNKSIYSPGPAGRIKAGMDSVAGGAAAIPIPTSGTLHWTLGAQMLFNGWAVDAVSGKVPKTVLVSFDKDAFRANLTNVGRPGAFTVVIPSTEMRPGLHHLTISGLDDAGHIEPTAYKLVIFISTM